jgi:hypothetical protein
MRFIIATIALLASSCLKHTRQARAQGILESELFHRQLTNEAFLSQHFGQHWFLLRRFDSLNNTNNTSELDTLQNSSIEAPLDCSDRNTEGARALAVQLIDQQPRSTFELRGRNSELLALEKLTGLFRKNSGTNVG